MGAATSYQSDWLRVPTRREIIDKYLRYDGSEVAYAYMGWHGVGMSMGAKVVAHVAKESNLFETIVLVTAGERCSSLGKLQRRIAEQLGLILGQKERNDNDINEEEEKEIDWEVSRKIIKSLGVRKFLLIIDNLLLQTQRTNDVLGSIGVSTTTARWTGSKILITTPYFRVISAMNIRQTFILQSRIGSESNVPSDVGSIERLRLYGGIHKLLDLFHDEASDVAKTLGISDQVEQVFSCFIYLSLFQQRTSMDAKELLKYYVGEGFFTAKQQQQLDGLDGLEGAFRLGEAVLAQLVSRCMAEETSSVIASDADGKKISLNSHLWKILDSHPEGHRYLKEKLHVQLEATAAGNSMLEDKDNNKDDDEAVATGNSMLEDKGNNEDDDEVAAAGNSMLEDKGNNEDDDEVAAAGISMLEDEDDDEDDDDDDEDDDNDYEDDDEDDNVASARWVSLSHNKIKATDHLPLLFIPTTRCAHQLSTLLLNDNPHLKQIPDAFFHQMSNLKVLDLSRTSISSFPTSFSSLVDLKFLKLQQCPSLESLPPSLKHLKQLIILDLRGTPLISIPSEALEQKTNLRFIDLSHTSINYSHLPPSFSALCNLEQLWLAGCGSVMSSSEGLKSTLAILDLSYSPDLKSLPTSLLMNFTNLKKLLLKGCNAFEGPPGLISSQLRLLSALEELDMSGCGALKHVENVSLEDLPKLQALNLSHTKIARLSITKCASLEMVRLQGLTNLKSLHLSSIKIKEFPHEILESTCLEELRLTDVKQLRRVEWEKVQWFPEKLGWDECGCCSSFKPLVVNNLLLLQQLVEELGGENRGEGAFISVSNGNIFKGLSISSPLWKQSLSKFHFYISPCVKQREKKEKQTRVGVGDGRKKQSIGVAYASIYSKMKMDRLHYVGGRRDFSRRLEIEGDVSLSCGDGDERRRLVETVVRRAEVLWLRENGFVKSLSDLIDMEEMEGMEECWVEKCHNIHTLFPGTSRTYLPRDRLWVSELGSLRSVYDGSRDFRSLKHLHIQFCPKLETLFPEHPYLIQLETLHIRFCARLESVFKGNYRPLGEDAFPKLRSLYLWELPKLKQICGCGDPPSLQHLRVRGCPHLQHLPTLDGL